MRLCRRKATTRCLLAQRCVAVAVSTRRIKHATIASGLLMFVFVLLALSSILLVISARLATKSPGLEGYVR